MIQRGLIGLSVVLALAVFAVPGRAARVTLNPIQDNSLYEHGTGALSNGSGSHLFSGRVGIAGGGLLRRALMKFDIAGNIPGGAIIHSVTLTMRVTRTPPGAPPRVFDLHRLSGDWGEGASDAPLQEGMGAASASNDATWIHDFFSSSTWTTPGGDFSATVSGSTTVAGLGSYTWGSTSQMVADVQSWLDAPGSNFGWILLGEEASILTGRRFASRENPSLGNRPALTVSYYELTGMEGVVNSGTGPVTDVLKINGSAGGANRVVCVATNDPITVSLDDAPTPGTGKYVLWVWPTLPCNPSPLMSGSDDLGTFINPTPLQPGSPRPFRCVRSSSLPNAVCRQVREISGPQCAPWMITAGNGLSVPASFGLQALISDGNAGNSLGFSATNAIILKVE